MKFIALLGILLFFIDPSKTSKINSVKSEARKAFEKGDMKTAISKYRYLIDSLGVTEDEVAMNLANAYFLTNDTVQAQPTYQSLLQSKDNKIKSAASQQLGVISNRQGKFEEALGLFKEAIKSEPRNEQARYNYEMIKKKLEEQKKKEQNQDKNNKDKKDDQKKDDKDQKDKKEDQKNNQDKDKKDQQNKDQKEKEQKEKEQKEKEQKEKEQKEKREKEEKDKNDEKDKKPSPASEKLKEMHMSEEKAKMILEAMKNQEVQYYQQNKRKATKSKNKGKPDW